MRILRREEEDWRRSGEVVDTVAAAAAVIPLLPTQSSCSRSQLRQPSGRPSHLTFSGDY